MLNCSSIDDSFRTNKLVTNVNLRQCLTLTEQQLPIELFNALVLALKNLMKP